MMSTGELCPYLDGLPCVIRWNGAVYTRPLNPSDKWENLSATNQASPHRINRYETSTQLTGRKSQSKTLITALKRKSSPSLGPEDRHIIDSMCQMMEAVTADLSSRYTMFGKCCLLKTGSIFEGVKLGPPDEFDFMIDLPFLVEHTQLKVEGEPPQPNTCHLVTINLSNSVVFSDLFPNSFRIIVEKSKYCPVVRNTWYRRLFDVIGDSMKRVLPEGWHWEPVNEMQKWSLDSGKVFTYNLRWEGEQYPRLHVSVDIVLSIPLNETPEFIHQQEMGTQQAGGVSREGPPGRYAADSSMDGNQDLVYTDDTELRVIMTQPGVQQVRLTTSVIESTILTDPCHEEAKVVLRMAKFLARRCIGSHLDKNTHRLISRVPTYWIKTIWLYLLPRYPLDAWVGLQNQQDRLLEVFITLLQCMNVKWLSSFFTPGYNVMKMKGMTSLALGVSTDNHVNELFKGLHQCIEAILAGGTIPKRVTSEDTLTNMKLRTLLFYVSRQRNVWGRNLSHDQEMCRRDAGSRDSSTLEAGLRGYISTHFPDRFQLTFEGNEWSLYEGEYKVDVMSDYEDIVKGDYFHDRQVEAFQSPSKTRKVLSRVATLFKTS